MIAAFIAGCVLTLLVAVLVELRRRDQASQPQRIPRDWPLLTRPVATSSERKVWAWLGRALPDQHIMLKLPVTRFTMPARRDEAQYWFGLLNRVYCTFTVCAADGRVLGCVDVPGRHGLSMSNQTLKHGLLSQCAIPYWVLDPDALPHMQEIRQAFLGDAAAQEDALDSRFRDVAGNLHAAVSRRRTHMGVFHPEASGSGNMPLQRDATLADGWEQNSFLAPADSRAAELKNESRS